MQTRAKVVLNKGVDLVEVGELEEVATKPAPSGEVAGMAAVAVVARAGVEANHGLEEGLRVGGGVEGHVLGVGYLWEGDLEEEYLAQEEVGRG